jgi:hypothetical protein
MFPLPLGEGGAKRRVRVERLPLLSAKSGRISDSLIEFVFFGL